MIHNYSIECFNIDRSRWEVKDLARTFDEAFDLAESYIGFHKLYDTVAILDMQGCFVWKSDEPIASRLKDIGAAVQRDEQEQVAPDGSV